MCTITLCKGIGKNFAKTLAQAGAASVGIFDVDATGANDTCHQLQQEYPNTRFIPYAVVSIVSQLMYPCQCMHGMIV
jgi:sorbose reductase